MAVKGAKLFDIKSAVTEWAWDEYVNTENRKQRNMRKQEDKYPGMYLSVNIDWSDVVFNHTTKWPPRLTQQGVDKEKQVELEGVDLSQQPELPRGPIALLFETSYTNNTDEDQEYTIQTSKSTRSECSTNIEQSWTKGVEMGITLKIPGEILEENAGFSREHSVTNSHGQVFEHTVTWGVDSQIKVKGGHVATASLVVNEEQYSGKFTLFTTLQGQVYVSFNNLRDNNSLVKASSNNIARIVKWYQERRRNACQFVKVEDDVVTIESKGESTFRFGVKQEVIVNQVPVSLYKGSPKHTAGQ